MFSQAQRRDGKTRSFIEKLRNSGRTAPQLWQHCCEYVRRPTRASLETLVKLIWGAGGRNVAVVCTFPACMAPDRFPMVDIRVAKWAEACLRKHNAADPQGPQLVPAVYPHDGATA